MWSTSDWKTQSKYSSDERGMTLVEVLVAFAVSAIILTSLGYMLVTSLQLYLRTGANVEVQNETQTALNLVLDSIVGAGGVCLIEQDPAGVGADEVTCALLGDLTVADDKSMTFTGDAIMWQPGTEEMYLMSVTTYDLGTCTDETAAPIEAINAMKGNLPADRADRLPYLMAQHVTAFSIQTAEESFTMPEPTPTPDPSPSPGAIKYYFNNPLVLNVSMTVETTYQGGKSIARDLGDSATVRNRLDYVYIQRLGKGMTKYLRRPV